MPRSQTVKGRKTIVPTPENMKLPVSALSFTRGNKTKCKGVVEDVDVRFCRDNSLDELDLGNKYEEAGEEGKDCCRAKYIAHHLCNMKRNDTNIMYLQI